MKRTLAEMHRAGSLPKDPTFWNPDRPGEVHIGDDVLGHWMERHLVKYQWVDALKAFKIGKYKFTHWEKQLRFLIDTFGREACSGVGKVGKRTHASRSASLYRSLERLANGGGRPERALELGLILNMKVKHVVLLAKIWEEEELAPKTRAGYLSDLRILCSWMGKRELVPEIPDLGKIGLDPAQFEVTTYAEVDKSAEARAKRMQDSISREKTTHDSEHRDESPPTTVAINPGASAPHSKSEPMPGGYPNPWLSPEDNRLMEAVYTKAASLDVQLELMLRGAHAFGFRLMEVLRFQPHKRIHDTYIEIDEGSKGGRYRKVPIETDYQRNLLERMKGLAKPGKSLSYGKKPTLKATEKHYRYLISRCGITHDGDFGFSPHALRHSYLHARYHLSAGVPAPIKDPHAVGDAERVRIAQQLVAEEAGHGRRSASTAYLGSETVAKRIRESERAEQMSSEAG